MSKELIKTEIEKYVYLLKEQLKNSFEIKTIQIDANFLWNEEGKAKEECKSQLEKLKLELFKKNPVLYWFEFENGIRNQEQLYARYNNFVEDNKKKEFSKSDDYKSVELVFRRAFSSVKVKNKNDFQTKTLYVGKVETDIWGRLAVHSGWGTNPKTAGMQLKYWFKPQEYGNLLFNYIVLDKSMKYFVEVLEKELRNELKPLIGKK